METLQIYWWLLIAVLGGALVFLLFVQGGQSLLLETRGSQAKNLIVNSLGRKWELTFTTLVVFGGAFFASFPPVLLHILRRGLLALDGDSLQLRDPGGQL